MTFVTKLRFQSGDRAALDDTVERLKRTLERKGVECKGPHSAPPERVSAPQYRDLGPGDTFDSWTYSVYSRSMEIHGSDDIAREVTQEGFPESIHVEIEIDRKKPLGQGEK